jgi:putative tryptophan/tyrosine transport system substrate-binding protein
MRRRDFLSAFGVAAVWPLTVHAQQSNQVRRIGYLSPAAAFNAVDEAFEKSLQELGWAKGHNIDIDYHYTSGRQDKIGPLVREAVHRDLELFVAWSEALAFEVKQVAPQRPLVFLSGSDGIAWGLVSSVARPGGYVTGIAGFASEQLGAKRLEHLREAIPSLTRVALLFSSERVSLERNRNTLASDQLRAAAKAFGVELNEVVVEVPQELETSMRAAKEWGAQAVQVISSGFSYAFAKEICDAANANGLPSIHVFREGALAGGLLAYGYDLREQARRAGAYVDKILRGTEPGSIPVEYMSKYELLINLKTAKALGMTVPQTLLVRADELIE